MSEQFAELSHRQEELERLLANAGVGLHWVTPTGRILWANQTELNRLGYSKDEYVGHSIDEFYQDPRKVQEMLDRLSRGEVLRNYEVSVVCKDGGVRDLLINSDRAGHGEVVYAQCFTQDVTDRLSAERALRQSEERYRAFIRNSSEGIWRLELDHPINPARPVDEQIACAYEWAYLAECNDAMARMYGCDNASALTGARLSDLFVRSDPKNEAFLRAFIASGYNLRDAESHEQDISGQDRYFRNSFIGVLENGLLVRAWGTQQEVTKQRLMQTALRESEERLRLAAEAGNVGLWEWNILNDSIVWSDRIYEFHGIQRDSFGSSVQDFMALIHSEDLNRVSVALTRAVEQQEPYDVEFRTVRPDGEIRWLSTSARVQYDAAGRPVRMFGAVLDITERRNYEERLRRSNEELEEFAFVTSHDLREPLRTVSIYTDLLLRRIGAVSDPDLSLYRQHILNGVNRAEALFRDLLIYSRVIHDDDSKETANLQRALEKSLRILEQQIAETDARILSDDLPVVRGEETQLEQVFQNLIGNSLKYRHPQRPPIIEIRAVENREQVTITVADNGCGFDPQYAEHIFGLFKRLQNKVPGTGLGLAICRRILERAGGRIRAESQPGIGSTFIFTLPRELHNIKG